MLGSSHMAEEEMEVPTDNKRIQKTIDNVTANGYEITCVYRGNTEYSYFITWTPGRHSILRLKNAPVATRILIYRRVWLFMRDLGLIALLHFVYWI